MVKAAHPARKSRARILKLLFLIICLFNVPVHDHHIGVRRQAVCNTLGDIEGSLLVLKDIVEVPAALSPEFFRLVFSHDKEGSREAVCKCAVLTDDRCRDNAAVSRIPGAWINYVMITDSLLLKKALISTPGPRDNPFHFPDSEWQPARAFRFLWSREPVRCLPDLRVRVLLHAL